MLQTAASAALLRKWHKINQIKKKSSYFCYPITDCSFTLRLSDFFIMVVILMFGVKRKNVWGDEIFSRTSYTGVCSMKTGILKIFGK